MESSLSLTIIPTMPLLEISGPPELPTRTASPSTWIWLVKDSMSATTPGTGGMSHFPVRPTSHTRSLRTAGVASIASVTNETKSGFGTRITARSPRSFGSRTVSSLPLICEPWFSKKVISGAVSSAPGSSPRTT